MGSELVSGRLLKVQRDQDPNHLAPPEGQALGWAEVEVDNVLDIIQ